MRAWRSLVIAFVVGSAPLSAQAITLAIKPRVGDTLRMRLDQESEITGVRKTAGLIDVPVVCGGVAVSPGDVVVADEEGIVVLPKGQAQAILAQAAQRADKDAKTTLAEWAKAHKTRIDELTRSLGL